MGYTGEVIYETMVFSKNNKRFTTQKFSTFAEAQDFVRRFEGRKWYMSRYRDCRVMVAGDVIVIAQSK